jgi:hypothetical protein
MKKIVCIAMLALTCSCAGSNNIYNYGSKASVNSEGYAKYLRDNKLRRIALEEQNETLKRRVQAMEEKMKTGIFYKRN